MAHNHKTLFTTLVVTLITLASCSTNNDCNKLSLWYDEPADEWMKALPIGNGRLGAMVYGGVNCETIALNEITFWTGGRDENQDPQGGAEHLAEMRASFFANDYNKLHDLAGRYLVGRAEKFGTHIPVGNMNLLMSHSSQYTHYKRTLDLNEAIVKVEYKVGDTLYQREAFCSNPAQVMVIKMKADKPQAIGFDLSLQFEKQANIGIIGNKIVFSGSTEVAESLGVNYAGVVQVETVGGICGFNENSLQVRNADEVVIYYDLNTDFSCDDYAVAASNHIDAAQQQSYDELRVAHINDYKPLFSRVTLDLQDNKKSQLPTDDRLKLLAQGEKDNALAALFMQYGRYLLIAGSREDSPLPINLQGVWNDNLACNMGWTCDYHLDINTQQNYWHANVCNLAECNRPLFNYIASLVEPGRKTVKTMYGTRGWTAHTTANAWGHTPCSGAYWWGGFPTGGTWLALQMVEHYRYTQDSLFMLNEAYPILKENAQFLLDFLTPCPNTGYLLTGPSISPENSFTYNGGGYCLTMMPTVDRALTYELFTALIDICKQHNFDHAFADSLQNAVDQLPPYLIGSKGQLQEWFIDYEERQPNHRHTSHLVGLYPYAQMNTSELEQACRVAIENRLNAPGWEDTEWSRANTVCYYARLKEGDNAEESLRTLLTDLSRENLFTMSPAGIAGADEDIFCPDGNMAGSAAVAEMLLQSHKGYIEILPALPTAWSDGSFTGLCVRGGGEVSATWHDSRLKSLTLTAKTDNHFKILIPDCKHYSICIDGIATNATTDANNLATVALNNGSKCEIMFNY